MAGPDAGDQHRLVQIVESSPLQISLQIDPQRLSFTREAVARSLWTQLVQV